MIGLGLMGKFARNQNGTPVRAAHSVSKVGHAFRVSKFGGFSLVEEAAFQRTPLLNSCWQPGAPHLRCQP